MKNKKQVRIGKHYVPERPLGTETEVIGNYWRAWFDGSNYFFEYDSGHFATRFSAVQISKADYLSIKSGEQTDQELTKKFSR